MKVVEVSTLYYPNIGGVETHVKNISEQLVNRGFEITVLATDPSGKLPAEEEMNGVKIKRFRAFAPFNTVDLRRYSALQICPCFLSSP